LPQITALAIRSAATVARKVKDTHVTTMREFLDILGAELAARGVRHELIGSQPGLEPGIPPYISVSGRAGRTRRIHVHLAYYWYYWGSEPEARWSVFRPDVAAEVITYHRRRSNQATTC